MTAGARAMLAEAVGTAMLLATIVGSGIVTSYGGDPASQLFRHAVAVGAVLVVLIVVFGPVSGAHFNPVVTAAAVRLDRFPLRRAVGYFVAQLVGGFAGVAAVSWTFGNPVVQIATTVRSGWGVWVSEAVVTAALVVAIFALVRTGRLQLVGSTVGLLIGAAIFASASTGFANPAVTIARVITDSGTGIAPASVVPFLLAQGAGMVLAIIVVIAVFPLVPPNEEDQS